MTGPPCCHLLCFAPNWLATHRLDCSRHFRQELIDVVNATAPESPRDALLDLCLLARPHGDGEPGGPPEGMQEVEPTPSCKIRWWQILAMPLPESLHQKQGLRRIAGVLDVTALSAILAAQWLPQELSSLAAHNAGAC